MVGTDTEDIVPALARHLATAGFGSVEVQRGVSGLLPATRLDPEDPWVNRVAWSVETTTGIVPAIFWDLGEESTALVNTVPR